VTPRELARGYAALLKQVDQDQTPITIEQEGVPLARLVPISPEERRLTRLAEHGTITQSWSDKQIPTATRLARLAAIRIPDDGRSLANEIIAERNT
jgi:prevent-host-death family protein